jgi:tape measure domain-containing protein
MGFRTIVVRFDLDDRPFQAGLKRAVSSASGMRNVFEELAGEAEESSEKTSNGFRNAFVEAEKYAQRFSKSTSGGFRNVFTDLDRVSRSSLSGFDRMSIEAARHAQQTMQAIGISDFNQFKNLLNQRIVTHTNAAKEETRIAEQVGKAATRVHTQELKEFQNNRRQQVKITETSARDSARHYNNNLGSGFFSKLGKEATSAFKRNFNITGGEGSGGILSGALAVAGGNAVTNILGKLTSAITGTVSAGFDFNRLQEQTALGFKVMMKDGEKALSFMRELQSFEKESPMDLPGVYTGAQRLMAMGFQAKEVIPILRAAGDAAAGLGKVGSEATAKAEQVTLALGQMWQKGKVSAEEMSQQLVEAGIPAWRYLGDEIARTDANFAKLTDEQRTAKVMKMAERNMFNARTAVAVIVKGMERDFEGLGKEIAEKTASGLETNISSSFSRQMGTATAPAFEQYKKVLSATLGALNSEVADKFVGGISTGTGALFDAMDFTLKAVTTGDIGGLGISAVHNFTEGIKSSLPQAVTAGASIIQSAVTGGEQAHGAASAKWSEMGKQASVKFYEGFAHGKGLLQQEQQEAGRILSRVGDTLPKIAERYRLPVEALIQANQKLIEQLRQIDERLPVTMADIPAGMEINIPQYREALRNKPSRRNAVAVLSAEVEAALQATAAQYGIDPALIRAMISQESGGKHAVTSNKGARGILQLMPATAQAYGLKVGNGVDERTNPILNLRAGIQYMADLLDMFKGDVRLALAGYNAGEGAVQKYGNTIPPYKETQNYVRSIMANYERMKGQDGLASTDQTEILQLRAAIASLQKSIDSLQYAPGTPMTTVTERGDIVGGAMLDAGVPGQRVVQIPEDAIGSARTVAIFNAVQQQKELEQLADLQIRLN